VLLAKTLRSTTFRLALTFIAIFGAMVIALFAFVYHTTEAYVHSALDRAIENDQADLLKTFDVAGRAGLVTAIKQAASGANEVGNYYLLAGPDSVPLAGNLKSWPPPAIRATGLMSLKFQDMGGVIHSMRVSLTKLADGSHLLVGRSTENDAAFMRKVRMANAAILLLIGVLAAVSSITSTRRTVGRIESINATSQKIMEDDLTRRIPLRGTRDEWDKLAQNLNSMLDRIETLMREMKEVTDNVAHDLRTPLTRIYSRLERARSQPRLATEDQALIADTMSDLDDVLRIFSSLMRISQIETSNRTAAFRTVNLVEIASDVVELFDAAAEDRRIQMSVTANSKAFVTGDRDLLFDAFANLVDNAIKHGREGGVVTVAIAQDETAATVTISDDGPGIPPEEFSNLFRRFYRLERSRRTPGNGLGLSLVAAIARLHGARIDLSDNNPGAVFRLNFPKRG
jgi:signal transduction histidine kinase